MEKNEILSNVLAYLREQQNKESDGSVVPVSGSKLMPEDIASVVECALGGWVTEGEYSKKFSSALKTFLGVRFSKLVNSGSSANLVAFSSAVDIWGSKGNYQQFKVLTSAVAFPTTVSPIMQSNLIPLFLDADPQTLNPTLEDTLYGLERPDVAGIILAHTLGFPYYADVIRERCDQLGKFFIEDACDALGATIAGKMVGSFGHFSTLSFFPAHHITTGEGGAIFTDDPNAFRTMEKYTNWGRGCWCLPGKDNSCGKRFGHKYDRLPDGYDHKYVFEKFGYNLKMTDLQAALGFSQTSRLENIVKKRKENFERLQNWLVLNYDEFLCTVVYDESTIQPSPFGFPVILRSSIPFCKNELVRYLEDNGIRTRPVFGGNIVRQPLFDNQHYEVLTSLHGSDYVMNNVFWIGCHPELTDKQLERIMSVFEDFMRIYR